MSWETWNKVEDAFYAINIRKENPSKNFKIAKKIRSFDDLYHCQRKNDNKMHTLHSVPLKSDESKEQCMQELVFSEYAVKSDFILHFVEAYEYRQTQFIVYDTVSDTFLNKVVTFWRGLEDQ